MTLNNNNMLKVKREHFVVQRVKTETRIVMEYNELATRESVGIPIIRVSIITL